MKMQWFLLFYSWNIWIIITVQAVCTDRYGSQYCNKGVCENPGLANYCKKTCNLCTDEECSQNTYKQSNGQCTHCRNTPTVLIESYNTSCPPCEDGRWGSDCTKICSRGCNSNTCNKWTGTCRGGCKFCYSGDKCVVSDNCDCDWTGVCRCRDGYFGDNCIEICSYRCSLRACNDNGHCKFGCINGWYGEKCDVQCLNCRNNNCWSETGICTEGCKTGYYGTKCDKDCSHNCVNKICREDDGWCDEGCSTGWFGDKCNTRCSAGCKNQTCNRTGRCDGCNSGLYGDVCDRTCPQNCKNSTCKQSGGNCNHGCKKRYFGDKCENPCFNCIDNTCQVDGKCSVGCVPGWFGDQCNRKCPVNCISDSCERSHGSCRGCKHGYKGSQCYTSCSGQCTVCDQYGYNCSSCEPGWYGETCEKTCNGCIDGVCNITDGYCVRGCKIGFYDSFCKTPCSSNCQVRKDGTHCARDTGHCTDGCTDGWFGDRCQKECSHGCNNKHCNRTTGRCTDGCSNTTYGVFCNNSCSDHCYKKQCHIHNMPTCTKGCEDHWWGDYCNAQCPIHCLRCSRLNGTCLEYEESMMSSSEKFVWILMTSVCVLILLVIFLLIQRGSCRSCIARGIYISPSFDDGPRSVRQSGLPLNHLRLSGDQSDYGYAIIADRDVESILVERSNEEYESI